MVVLKRKANFAVAAVLIFFTIVAKLRYVATFSLLMQMTRN